MKLPFSSDRSSPASSSTASSTCSFPRSPPRTPPSETTTLHHSHHSHHSPPGQSGGGVHKTATGFRHLPTACTMSVGVGKMLGEVLDREVKAESPTSDYGEESGDAMEVGELTGVGDQQQLPLQALGSCGKTQQLSGLHSHQSAPAVKPPFSFSCLIFMAIEASEEKALPVKSIYTWVLEHFPYFRTAPNGWKNSVRHNLSLNKCFRKVDKSPSLGKGSLWQVDPTHRPTLLQSLSKVPGHALPGGDRGARVGALKASITVVESSFAGSSQLSSSPSIRHHTAPAPPSSLSIQQQQQQQLQRRPEAVPGATFVLNSTKPTSKDVTRPPIQGIGQRTGGLAKQNAIYGDNPSRTSTSQHNGDNSSYGACPAQFQQPQQVVTAVAALEDVPVNASGATNGASSACVASHVAVLTSHEGGNCPDPTLFPYLARRLEEVAGAGVCGGTGAALEDVVDAANAMLTLKHGPQVMAALRDPRAPLPLGDKLLTDDGGALRRKKRGHQVLMDSPMMVINSSCSLDHAYTHHSTLSSSTFTSPSSSTPSTPPHLIIPVTPSCITTTTSSCCRRNQGFAAALTRAKEKRPSPTSSVDEAFSDESFESDGGSPSDVQQRLDGADALLNFAARASTLLPRLMAGQAGGMGLGGDLEEPITMATAARTVGTETGIEQDDGDMQSQNRHSKHGRILQDAHNPSSLTRRNQQEQHQQRSFEGYSSLLLSDSIVKREIKEEKELPDDRTPAFVWKKKNCQQLQRLQHSAGNERTRLPEEDAIKQEVQGKAFTEGGIVSAFNRRRSYASMAGAGDAERRGKEPPAKKKPLRSKRNAVDNTGEIPLYCSEIDVLANVYKSEDSSATTKVTKLGKNANSPKFLAKKTLQNFASKGTICLSSGVIKAKMSGSKATTMARCPAVSRHKIFNNDRSSTKSLVFSKKAVKHKKNQPARVVGRQYALGNR